MLAHLLLERPHRVTGIAGEPLADRVLDRLEHALAPVVLGASQRDRRKHLDRRVEQHDSLDAVRHPRRELEREAAAERVAEERRPVDGEPVERLDDVCDVRLDPPRRLPSRAAVPAEIRRDDPEARRQVLLGEPAEPSAVTRHPVEADERRRALFSPFVHVQPHPGEDSRAMELEVVEGDIAALRVDAVANAANDHLWMGSGVAGALKRGGGEEVERDAVARGPIERGTAIATTAGRLSARYVIHGAVMGQDLRTDADLVRRTTRSCLELADELGCSSLALPAFGTGVGGFPLAECAAIMVEETRAFVPTALERVVFAVFGGEAAAVFRAALAR